MSNETSHVHTSVVSVPHETHDEVHHGHHHETFLTKYVFSQDHKTIAKQFLITGMFWALLGGLFSVIFRLQLGYPDARFPWMEDIAGRVGQRRTVTG
jgi:cytochrome c oxidase subunit I